MSISPNNWNYSWNIILDILTNMLVFPFWFHMGFVTKKQVWRRHQKASYPTGDLLCHWRSKILIDIHQKASSPCHIAILNFKTLFKGSHFLPSPLFSFPPLHCLSDYLFATAAVTVTLLGVYVVVPQLFIMYVLNIWLIFVTVVP